MGLKKSGMKKGGLKISTKMKHRLAETSGIPMRGDTFEKDLQKLNAEIKAWKEKLETSLKTQLAAKIGRLPKFSEAASGEELRDFITDDTGLEHLDILRKNPATYASRIAVVASTVRKGSGLNDQILRKILIQAAAGNYNTEFKLDKETRVDNVSSVNLRVVTRVQQLYFDAYIQECRKVLSTLKSKASSIKEDVYQQQRKQIRWLMSLIQANMEIVSEYRKLANNRMPDEKNKNVAFSQDVVLNLYDLLDEDLDEKQYKQLQQQAYNLVQVTRACLLLHGVGYRIAERLVDRGKYAGTEEPMGYFLKAQLAGDEYLLAFREFEKCTQERKELAARKLVETFKVLINLCTQAYSKSNQKTDAKLQTAIAVDFAEYLLNFYDIYNKFLIDALGMQPLSKEWLGPLLSKAKNALMSVDSSARIEDLYLKLENIGSEIGISQY